MEYVAFVGMIFFFIVLVMVKGFFDEKRKQVKFIEWLRTHYGELPIREPYSPADFERVSHYFKAHAESGFHMDDITWNDLNMDSVFERMNYTYSAAGEEYLYYLLRTPAQDENAMDALEKQISFFMDNKEERVKLQTFFAGLGKTGKFSIYDYLSYLDTLGERSNWKHYLAFGAIVLSLLGMFISTSVGILILVIVIARNIIIYFKEKNEIDPYIVSFGYILRLLHSTEEIEKMNLAAFTSETEELRMCRKKMNKFRTGSYIIMSPERMSASGNLLEIFFDYLRMVFHFDLIKFNNMLSEVRKNSDQIDRMITISGQMETIIAIGAYRFSMKEYCIPRFHHAGAIFAENMYHPLIGEPVKNSISSTKGVLLTGSNASGKSTFLKTVALNAVLAQTINTCMADSYTAGMYRILSSMALRDDLASGDSYYIVEIKSLKRILNAASEEGNRILCFVDEVLRGTNTVERIAASTQILASLSDDRVVCFAATHDIELTHLLQNLYHNYHFEEEFRDDDIVFNYRLMKGRATTRNAIRLLRVMGYNENIIKKAERLAEDFMASGRWELKGMD